ncbi:DNA mismatch endonuclease Vsr [Ferrimonas sediminicola]|uniref:Very short patch repair endonuclease n=1 Tax=Ferrimonas sediminicola TaxID=2569538 RepID=A0A4U1B7Q7_9GAMM|nr:DNA mismatch endonuclease Vsr [Ferrimonas sediminicola]TKB46011.1 DNA mismatch endonuclease Vsr [Ferrimonas sediminicola]
MVDTLTARQRSDLMSKVKSKDTSPEIVLRRVLHRLGLRFRLHRKDLPGHPDIVLPRYKAVVMVHGCFWHHHSGCKNATVPDTNTEFWMEKFARNVERDARVENELKELGWRVFVVWECELNTTSTARETGERLAGLITSNVAAD